MIHSLLRTVRRLRRHGPRAIAVVLVAALVITSLGIAVPVPVEKRATEQYPCAECSCGCTNAEMCWRDCCCYTNEQKVAWARKNGVTPPAYVLAAAKKPACCQRKVASCCSSKRSCCEKDSADDEASHARRETRKTEEGRSASIVVLRALRCQGLSSSWTLLPPTIVAPPGRIDYSLAGMTEQIESLEESFSGQLPPPESPPPQNDV